MLMLDLYTLLKVVIPKIMKYYNLMYTLLETTILIENQSQAKGYLCERESIIIKQH